MITNKSLTFFEEKKATHTQREILQQPSSWLKTLAVVKAKATAIEQFISDFNQHDTRRIILAGAGSSEFVGNSIVDLLYKQFGGNIQSIATTSIVSNPELYFDETPTLLISFGRSGNSPESIAAMELADQVCPTVYHLGITCNAEGKVATYESKRVLTLNLPPETHDQSFAMTSSFSSMTLAAYLALNIDQLTQLEASVQSLSEAAQQLIENDYPVIDKSLDEYDFKRIVYLGSNSVKGIAQETALKMLELTTGDIPSLFDTSLGFRHGPKSFVNDETLIVMTISNNEYTFKYDLDLFNELVGNALGKVIAVAPKSQKELFADAYLTVTYEDSLSNWSIGFIGLLVGQFIALHTSLRLGKTPDNPFPSGRVNRVVEGVVLHPLKK